MTTRKYSAHQHRPTSQMCSGSSGFTKKKGNFDKTHAICKKYRAAIKYISSTTNMVTQKKERKGAIALIPLRLLQPHSPLARIIPPKQTTAVAKLVRKVSQGIFAQTLPWQLTLPAHRQ